MRVEAPPRRVRAECGSWASGACARPTGPRGYRRSAPSWQGSTRGRDTLASPGDLRRFIQRPPQRRWPLAAQMPGRATLIGLIHGDVHPGVTNRLAGGGEPGAIAELGEDHDRGQLPDPVVSHQRLAPRLLVSRRVRRSTSGSARAGRSTVSSTSTRPSATPPTHWNSTQSTTTEIICTPTTRVPRDGKRGPDVPAALIREVSARTEGPHPGHEHRDAAPAHPSTRSPRRWLLQRRFRAASRAVLIV